MGLLGFEEAMNSGEARFTGERMRVVPEEVPLLSEAGEAPCIGERMRVAPEEEVPLLEAYLAFLAEKLPPIMEPPTRVVSWRESFLTIGEEETSGSGDAFFFPLPRLPFDGRGEAEVVDGSRENLFLACVTFFRGELRLLFGLG